MACSVHVLSAWCWHVLAKARTSGKPGCLAGRGLPSLLQVQHPHLVDSLLVVQMLTVPPDLGDFLATGLCHPDLRSPLHQSARSLVAALVAAVGLEQLGPSQTPEALAQAVQAHLHSQSLAQPANQLEVEHQTGHLSLGGFQMCPWAGRVRWETACSASLA